MGDDDISCDGPTRATLARTLANKYPTVDEARMLVCEVGLDPIRIAFSARADLTWFSILEEAWKQGGRWVIALLDRAAKDYPRDERLRGLRDEILHRSPVRALGDESSHPRDRDARATVRRTARAGNILPHDHIIEIYKAAVSADLAKSRMALLEGIDQNFVAGLSLAQSPAEQTLIDLAELNRVRRLTDGSQPLRLWLMNAVAIAGSREESAIFRCALASLSGELETGQ